MTTVLKLVFPVIVNNQYCRNEHSVQHQQIFLSVTKNSIGYTSNDTITIRNDEYDVATDLSVSGDQISGTIRFYDRRRKKTINNVLYDQHTTFPNMPIRNEWYNIKINGYGDIGILEISDNNTKTSNEGYKNSDIAATLEAIAIQNSSIISNNKTEFLLNGSDDVNWSCKPQSVAIGIPNNSAITSIKFDITELSLLLWPGANEIYGKSVVRIKPDSLFYLEYTRYASFSSPSTTSLYNTSFPWSNQWSLIDNINPTVSLIDPKMALVFLPSDDIQVLITLKVTGDK